MPLVIACVNAGVSVGGIGNDKLKEIDFKQIITLVEQGVIGKLVEIESADGDTIYITVE